MDSAKTEESKYWFPSHARKRSENAAAELAVSNMQSKATSYPLKLRSSLERGVKDEIDEQEQRIYRVHINSVQSSMSSSKAAETKQLPQRTLFVGSLLQRKPSDFKVTNVLKQGREPQGQVIEQTESIDSESSHNRIEFSARFVGQDRDSQEDGKRRKVNKELERPNY